MSEQKIAVFLTRLAVDKHVAPSTQNQAFADILFLRALNEMRFALRQAQGERDT